MGLEKFKCCYCSRRFKTVKARDKHTLTGHGHKTASGRKTSRQRRHTIINKPFDLEEDGAYDGCDLMAIEFS